MISSLGFGGATLTNLKSLREILQLLDLAYANGIRHFDTAPLYGQGYSEVIYGKFLKNKRQHVTVTTKFGLGEHNETDKMPVQLILAVNYIVKGLKKKLKGNVPDASPPFAGLPYRKIDKDLVRNSFEKSLKRLGTDHVDYYLLHEGLPSFLTDEALTYLLSLKQQGSVRNIGIGSNIEGIKQLTTQDVKVWDVLQYEHHSPGNVNELLAKFPDKLHFHHSCLRHMKEEAAAGVAQVDKAGYLLAMAALNNPKGKIIFSTRSQETFKKNIDGFSKYDRK